jgi:hypothetical protein
MLRLQRPWFSRYRTTKDILMILNRYCPTAQVTEEAKEKLHELGCKVLGGVVSPLG